VLKNLQIPTCRIGARNALWIVRQQDSVQDADLSELKEQCRLRCMITSKGSTCWTLKVQLMRLWIATAKEAIDTPEEKLIGTWCYHSRAMSRDRVEFDIIRNREGQVSWQQNHAAGKLTGALAKMDDSGWFHAHTLLPCGMDTITFLAKMDVGKIRLRYNAVNHSVVQHALHTSISTLRQLPSDQ